MCNKLKISLLSILLTLAFLANAQTNEFSKHSIKLSVGLGFCDGYRLSGGGVFFSFGYQRNIWKDRLRFNPNFGFGLYGSRLSRDARDMYFNSINLETNLFFDLIRIKAFSLVLGTGLLINNSRGFVGFGGDYDYISQRPQTSEYRSIYSFAGYLGGGFRINPKSKRIAINVMPYNLRVGNNYFFEFQFRIECDIKLR